MPLLKERKIFMKIKLSNEVMTVADGNYKAKILTIKGYNDNANILMKFQMEDEQVFVKFYKYEDLATYPWADVFRALNTDETDDLEGKMVEIEVVNTVSKTSGNKFCNIRRVKLISEKRSGRK